MKLSFDDKKEIYEKHCEGCSYIFLSKKYGIDPKRIYYLCKLVDKHGLDAIRHNLQTIL